MSSPAQALILAGGKGTRLHPYTAAMPKPLVPLGDKTVLEHLLLHLRSRGIRSAILAVSHMGRLIQSFFGDGGRLGMEISYSVEDRLLGTCGPIAAAIDRLAPDFLVLNGDLVTDLDVARMIDRHAECAADATVATMVRDSALEYGVLDLDADGAVLGYREKPVQRHVIGMGIYVLNRAAVRPLINPGERMDMPELLNSLVRSGRRVVSFTDACQWIDIGRPEQYARAQEYVRTQELAAEAAALGTPA